METKERLIQAASEHFLEYGYEKTSINKITASCNITKGAFYHHFKNKDEIYMAVLLGLIYEVDRWIREKIYSTSTMEELLVELFDNYDYFQSSLYIGNAGNMSARHYTVILDAIKRFPELKDRLTRTYAGCIDLFEQRVTKARNNGEIRKNVNPKTFTVQMFSLAEGLVFMSALMNEGMQWREQGLSIARDVWEMIKK